MPQKIVPQKRLFFLTITLFILSELSLIFLLWKPPQQLSPYDSSLIELFADTGTSTIDSSYGDKSITITYNLTNQYKWPFAGVRFSFLKGRNLQAYTYIELTVSVSKEQREIVTLWSAPLVVHGDTTQEHPHHYEVTFTPRQKVYKIPLSSFRTPPWWLIQHDISQSDLPVNTLQQVRGVGIRSGYQPKVGEALSFSVEKIAVCKEHKGLYKVVVLVALFFLFLLWLQRKWLDVVEKRVVVPLKDISVDITSDNKVERIITVIGKECDDSELSLFKVSQLSEVAELEVSKSIKEEFGLSFKQYLNQVRMEMATTLLRESELSIKEIGYRSGYKTSSHFFRVFRSFYHESPSEYRNRIMQKRDKD